MFYNYFIYFTTWYNAIFKVGGNTATKVGGSKVKWPCSHPTFFCRRKRIIMELWALMMLLKPLKGGRGQGRVETEEGGTRADHVSSFSSFSILSFFQTGCTTLSAYRRSERFLIFQWYINRCSALSLLQWRINQEKCFGQHEVAEAAPLINSC